MRLLFFTLLAALPAIGEEFLPPTGLPEDRAWIAEFCPSYYRRGKGTHAEYVTNRLSAGMAKRAIYRLQPERFWREFLAFGVTREEARRELEQFKADAERGFAWPHRNLEVTIPKAVTPPPLDGTLGGSWGKALCLRGEVPLDRAEGKPEGESEWFALYDNEFLYLAARIADRDVRTAPERMYTADSVEFFVMPDVAMRAYWEVIVNPDGADFSAWHQANDHGHFISRPGIRPVKLRTAAKRIPGGYVVQIALPLSAMATVEERLKTLHFMPVRTNLDGNMYEKSAPVPLLYDGHNYAGYIKATLK